MFNVLFKLIIVIILSAKCKFYKKNINSLIILLGPVFIKFGQILSTRSGLIGPRLEEELSKLRDRVPSFSGEKARKIINKELLSVDLCFKELSCDAIAAASVAQVHKATTVNGDIVAVKVLRPKIKKKIAKDIRLLRCLSFIIHMFAPKLRRLKLPEVVKTLEYFFAMETDLRLEAANASKLKENNIDRAEVYIPKIFWEYTTKNVMTIEWVDGFSIDSKEHMLRFSEEEKLKIAENLIISFFNQSYRDGFFHADMHPGNLIIRNDLSIALIDFGIVGFFDKKTRVYVAEILRGFLLRKYDYVAKIHFLAGYIPMDQSEEHFALACRSIGESIVGKSLKDISVARLLSQLSEITDIFRMETQIKLIMFQKSLVLLEGVSYALSPDVNIWDISAPWIQKWRKENINFIKKGKHAIDSIIEYGRLFDSIFNNVNNYLKPIANKQAKDNYFERFCKIFFIIFCIVIIFMLGFFFNVFY